jgi:hypothetical protein
MNSSQRTLRIFGCGTIFGQFFSDSLDTITDCQDIAHAQAIRYLAQTCDLDHRLKTLWRLLPRVMIHGTEFDPRTTSHELDANEAHPVASAPGVFMVIINLMNKTRSPVDPRAGRELWKEQHRRGAEWPVSWLVSAMPLERAAELLWDQHGKDLQSLSTRPVGDSVPPSIDSVPPSISGPAMLLAALTIENLLKGILVSREAPFRKRGKFQLKTHKLLDLVARIGLMISEDERFLLERLEEFLEWAGRYPIPVSYERMLPRTLPEGGFAPLPMISTDDRQLWRQLVIRIRGEINTARELNSR